MSKDDMETNTMNVMFDGNDEKDSTADEHLLSHVDDLQHDLINLPLWVKANRSR